MLFTKPISNQDFYDLLELWDSYKSQIALVIQLLKMHLEHKIPAEVTDDTMGMLNLKPESCSSLQLTCPQYSTSCLGRMKRF